MTTIEPSSRRVAVIGGGISGLAAAHRLIELEPACRVRLFESQSRLGGVLGTVHEQGFQVERSADNFITTVPWALDLCRRLGLTDQLVQTDPTHRQTYVVRRGRLHRLPDGFLMMAPTQMWPLALTPILSPLGKLRAAMEYFIPPRKEEGDESMAAFVRRRLGREVFQRLVEPLVSGVYAADMEKLSVEATLVRFREMERQHGSLIRAMRHQMKQRPPQEKESGARYSMFVALRDGLSSLVAALAARLPAETVRLNAPVQRLVRRARGGWRVVAGREETAEEFDAVILATPAHVATDLMAPLDRRLSDDLAAIPHSGTAILTIAYDRAQVGHSARGAGFVVPALEGNPILACSFSNRKYPHRAPHGTLLLRVFTGGAARPGVAEWADRPLRQAVEAEIKRLLKITGKPTYCHIDRWPNTMPQYHVGHKRLVARIEERAQALGGLQLVGNAYHGVGIPDCIHGGETAVERLLGDRRPGGSPTATPHAARGQTAGKH